MDASRRELLIGGASLAAGGLSWLVGAPSVLVSEVELQRLPEDRARPPILASPFHDE